MNDWTVAGTSICFLGEIASVEEIEESLADGADATIRSELPDIRFSRMALQPRLLLRGKFPSSIALSYAVSKNGRLQSIDPQASSCVFQSTWHSVDWANAFSSEDGQGPLESIHVGPISAGDYIKVLSAPRFQAAMINEVELGTQGEIPVAAMTVPATLNASLYPYQVLGSAMMRVLAGYEIGTLLADEMGLGKTIQVISVLLTSHFDEPSVVVAPAFVLENWRRELARFAPTLEILVHEGPRRGGTYKAISNFDVVLVSYDTLVSDRALFESMSWGFAIADEAQMIRNTESQRAIAVKRLRKKVGIAVTGTPVENRVGDLWSIAEFVLPELLGSKETFDNTFGNSAALDEYLGSLMSSISVRRAVNDVANDLPDRTDVYTALTPDSSTAGVLNMSQSSNAGIADLVRQQVVCAHAGAEDGRGGIELLTSRPKMAHTLNLLTEVFARGEKALVFCSYLASMERLEKVIANKHPAAYVRVIHGGISRAQRQEILDEFTDSSSPGCLVLQIDAAGIGLNITSANHVIFFNPDWNPAKTRQAAARAFRRGQNKPVIVHHLFYANTVEERQMDLASQKQLIADSVSKGMSEPTDAEARS